MVITSGLLTLELEPNVVVARKMAYSSQMSRIELNLASLSVVEKLELIADVWQSMDEGQVPLTDDMRAELDRRIARVEKGEGSLRSWDEVRAGRERMRINR